MYKLLLVDDEFLVRTNLKLLLHGFSEDITICGEAADGEAALKLLDSLKPDIVLSDIRMPNMDGLSLCKIIHSRYPHILFIALSNYDDYEYVRGALKNGAIDYLLKHKLNPDSIRTLIKNIRIHAPGSEYAPVSNPTENALNTLRNKFVLNLLSNLFLQESEIETNLKILSIKLDMRKVIPIILAIDNYYEVIKKYDLKGQSVLEFSILNIGNEILSQYPTGILTHVENENYCILLSFADVSSSARIEDTIRLILQQLSASLKTYLNISTSFSIGSMCAAISSVSKSYEKAKKILQFKFYAGNQSILRSADIMESKEPLRGLDFQTERKLLTVSSAGNDNEVLKLLRGIFEDMQSRRLRISNAQMIFTDLISILTRIAKEKNILLDSLFTDRVHPSEMLTQYTTLIQIQKWFFDSFLSLCRQIQLQSPGDSEYVRKAIGLITQKYAKPISQQTIADEIGISSGYLSTIFKLETGQGFSDYLNSYRISMAVHMLEAGETDFHKIACECGFQEYSYFFKVFKKKQKVTPKEYRRAWRQKSR